MPDLEILIKTRTELAGAEQAAQSLEKMIGAAKASGKPYADMESQLARIRGPIDAFKNSQAGAADATAGLTAKLREVVPGFAKLQDLFSGIATGATGYIAVALAAIGAAAKVAAAGIREYAEAQEQVTKLDAALAQTGQLTDAYREKLQGLAVQMQDLTAQSHDKWTAVLTKLTQFGAKPDNIEQYANAVKNLAGVMGGDIEGAAQAMVRAMGGNYIAFSRLGIKIDETLAPAAKLAELFKKIADIGGGQLEASARTLTGQYHALRLAISEVFEGVGLFLAKTGVLQTILDGAATAAKAFGEAIGGTVPKVDGLVNSAERTVQSVDGAAGSMGRGKTAAEAYTAGLKKASDVLTKLVAQEESRLSFQEKLDAINMRKDMAAIASMEKRGLNPIQAEVLRGGVVQNYADKEFKRRDESKAFVQTQIGTQADTLATDIGKAEADKKAEAVYTAKAAPLTKARQSEREALSDAENMKAEADRAKIRAQISLAIVASLQTQIGPILSMMFTGLRGGGGAAESAAAASAETAAKMQRRVAQNLQGQVGQPPVPTSKPGFDIEAAKTERAGLVERYNTGQLERARGAEIYGAERGLNDMTAGGNITAQETKAVNMKPVADAAAQFNVNYDKFTADMATVIRGMLNRITASDNEIKKLARELQNTKGVVSNLRTP